MTPFDLTRAGGANPASLTKIELIPCGEIASYPGQVGGQLAGAIVLREGTGWSRLYGADQSRGFEETSRLTDHGRVNVFRVRCFYPGDTGVIRSVLAATVWTRFVVRVTDTVGLARVIGSDQFGLMLDYESIIAAEMGGQRGTSFTLSGELPIPSALVVA